MSNSFVRFASHILKIVVNLNLIIMFKPKYTCIFIFTGRYFIFFFFSVVASGTLHFYSGFSVKFWLTTLAFGLASQAQAKKHIKVPSVVLEMMVFFSPVLYKHMILILLMGATIFIHSTLFIYLFIYLFTIYLFIYLFIILFCPLATTKHAH